MRKQFLFLLGITSSMLVQGQSDSVQHLFAFRINEYKVPLSDTVTVIQVSLPDASPFKINKDQVAVLKHRYGDSDFNDTTMIGWGRCNLIKSNYYYFGIHHQKERLPQQGDLLYTSVVVPYVYKGLLFETGTHAIRFVRVDENQFYYSIEMFTMTKERESALIDSMISDIRYTGKAMLQQSPEQDQTINGGIFDGKKVFSAMQEVTSGDVENFLKYIIARPAKYAGNTWKISEIFATWMTSKTPVVNE